MFNFRTLIFLNFPILKLHFSRLLGLGIAVVIFLLSAIDAGARAFKSDEHAFDLVEVAKGLRNPWSLAWLPDGRMLVTEKVGKMRLIGRDGKVSAPIAGVPKVAYGGQGGLLDVVVDPEFKSNSTIFFSFSEAGNGGRGTAVARGVLEKNQLRDVRIIWRQTPKSGGGIHFGSRIVIAPDGTLFVTIGDRGQRQRAQDPKVNRGQVIRINKDGTIPADNPFIGRDGYRPEIWSYGHRNPQGAALHPVTGKLWVVEHGARGGDEINMPKAGKNYGWPIISFGRHYSGRKIGVGTSKAGMEQPVYYWDPSIAPSGMAFYTGDKFPAWKGSLFVGALGYQLLARLTLDGAKVVKEERILRKLGSRIRDVRQGPDGYIYVVTDGGSGKIYRLQPGN